MIYVVCNRKFTLIGFLGLVVLALRALLQPKDNSPGDQQMLDYIKAGDGARLAVLLLHLEKQRCAAHFGSALSTFLSLFLRNEAPKSSLFPNHLFTESPQMDSFEIGKQL